VKSFSLAVATILFAPLVRAATLQLTPVADTTLSQNFPSNNFGAMPFANAGTTQNNTKNRALFRFDFSAIPMGSRIDAASLKLEVVSVPNEPPTPADMSLHRLLVSWGEGNKTNAPGGGAGKGSPATAGEATWQYRFAATNAWASPGGATTNDFSARASAANTIYGVSDYYFPPAPPATTPALVADVQFWLTQPAQNFGWLLLCDNEQDTFTARRYGTREDAVNTPLLTVTYTPAPRLQLTPAASNQFQFTFAAEAGRAYVVESRASFAATNAWLPLTNFSAPPADTNLTVTLAPAAAQKFFRVTTP
jgi:hypothetical protein